MSKRRKYSPEEKLEIVREYLSGKSSLRENGQKLGYTSRKGFPGCFERWIALYRQHDETAFFKEKGNATYIKSLRKKSIISCIRCRRRTGKI